ncbi:MAG TPA: GNAT family N-acetyltransferase [Alphaproteobacteria bacterium]
MASLEPCAARGPAFTVQVADNCTALRKAWLYLEENGYFYAFQSFAWISTLLGTVGAALGAEPALVLISDESGAPVMLIPLALRKWAGLTFLEFVDFGPTDYNAPLVQKAYAGHLTKDRFRELWQTVLRTIGPIDVVRLDKIPARIGAITNPFLHLTCREYETSHQAPLEGDFAAFLRARSSKLMADSRRRRRRVAEKGRLEFRIARTPAEAEALTDVMIHLKSRRYQATGAYDKFEHRYYRDFYLQLAREQAAGGIVHVSALMLDDVPIAVHWGLASPDRFYWIMPAYDADCWRPYSVGRLLLEDVIRWCYENRISVFDFTIGDEPFKREWADRSMPLYLHRAALSTAGRAYFKVRRGLTRMRERTRQYPLVHNALRTIGRIPQRWLKGLRYNGLLARN